MIKPIQVFALTGFAALGSCTASPAGTYAAASSSGAQCFRAHEITRYTHGPDGLVTVQATAGRWYSMHLSSDCPSMDWLMQIAVRPWDSLWLCEGENARLIAPDPAGMHPQCIVSEVRPVSAPAIATMESGSPRHGS